jgi:alanine racemase
MTPDRVPAPQAVPPHAAAVLAIDLAAIRTNWRMLAALATRAECAAVIKADGYGLGLEPVMSALGAEGCRTFFVATLDEAHRARRVSREADVYVLDGLLPGTAPGFAELGARPALGSLAEVREWSAFCAAIGRPLPAALHVDTGMRRLGLPPAEVAALAAEPALLASFELALLMSHLACADEPGHAMNAAQRQLFDAFRAALPPARSSLANSAGTLLGPAFHYHLVRPGIALYGGRALAGTGNPMKPALRLSARILQVREIETGDSVGYGASWVAQRPSRIATVAAGYADGIPRHVSTGIGEPGTSAIIAGRRAPLVGRVSMDVLALDVTDVPPGLAERGAFAELIGPGTSLDALADHAGTIGYELLTRLGRRAHRVYEGM